MIKKVLLVDDDRDLLLMSKEGLENYAKSFSVIIAEDGEAAIERLRRNHISLVVTDLQMPRIDGFGLLAHIMENSPDIPVIVMTGFATTELEKKLGSKGVVGYIQKPFMLDELAQKILKTLRMESEGGFLHGFSIGIFAQMIEAEQKTCTIRVFNRRSRQRGTLFFRDGDLLDARLNGISGIKAAYIILSWEEASLSIQNSCATVHKKIESELQYILLEAMRQKDHADSGE